MRELNATKLKEYLIDNTPFLLDVRQPWEYDICHLEGSHLIPMAQLPSKIEQLNKEQETVVICHHGIRSRMMGRFLESAGFEIVENFTDSKGYFVDSLWRVKK